MRFPIEPLRQVSEMLMPDVLVVRERRQIGRDEYGDPIYDEVIVVNTKCRLRSQGGGEQVLAGRLTVSTTAALDYPQTVGLTENMTVEVNGKAYNIVHIEVGSESFKAHNSALVARG